MTANALARPDKDSPNVLTGGAWVVRGNVQVWEPAAATVPRNVRTLRPVDLIACPACGARLAEHCHTAAGAKASTPHASRILRRTCGCGAALARGRELCDPCRDDSAVERQRAYARRMRAERAA